MARLVSCTAFARDDRVERVVHAEALPPAEIVRRAVESVGRDDFNILTHNCEHFATWCARDQWRSRQVLDVAFVLGFAAVARLLARAA